MAGLIDHFDEVLAELESAAGRTTARVQRPVVIFGSLDGILTTVRNQVRVEPIETTPVRPFESREGGDSPHQGVAHRSAKCHPRLSGRRGHRRQAH
jgi:hypothetical protein